MRYLDSYQGAYQNHAMRLPRTFNHMSQFLYHVKDENWGVLQDIASRALKGEISLPTKIKPSSLRTIRDKGAAHVVAPLLKEHIGHHDPTSEVHKGGGIHHAVESVLQIAGGVVGGEKVNSWVGGEVKHKALSDTQVTMAKLVSATYQDKRLENVGQWTRIDDYDSRYGSIWRNPQGKYVLSVRGTKMNMRDIWKDMKIAAGSGSQRDDQLVKSIRKFNQDHPNARMSVAAHSLGTQLVMNGMKEAPINGRDVYLFNPASSPFQNKKIIRDIIDTPDKNIQFFLNKGDVVSNYFSQNMTQDEIENKVFYGKFSRSPVSSHVLAQWVESY